MHVPTCASISTMIQDEENNGNGLGQREEPLNPGTVETFMEKLTNVHRYDNRNKVSAAGQKTLRPSDIWAVYQH